MNIPFWVHSTTIHTSHKASALPQCPRQLSQVTLTNPAPCQHSFAEFYHLVATYSWIFHQLQPSHNALNVAQLYLLSRSLLQNPTAKMFVPSQLKQIILFQLVTLAHHRAQQEPFVVENIEKISGYRVGQPLKKSFIAPSWNFSQN